MISPSNFYQKLASVGIDFYVGVPDSLLSNLCSFIDDNSGSGSHLITSNEGAAVGVACGYHLATGKIPSVYMQNSGLGNAVNPLLSIADTLVYKIPILMIIGWRGEPGVIDEPQHIKQGRVTEKMLNLMGVPYFILGSEDDYETIIERSIEILKKENSPVALLIKKNTFKKYKSKRVNSQLSSMRREEALKCILELCGDDMVVSTTGKTSREVYEIRKNSNQEVADFLTVGGMGHTASIALGISLARPTRRIICLDGDGSLIMHLGSSAIIGHNKPENLVHVLLNNAAHESVGGQPTVADRIDFRKVSSSFGYRQYLEASSIADIKRSWDKISKARGPIFFHVKIQIGSRSDLGRPRSSPEENKINFMKKLDER